MKKNKLMRLAAGLLVLTMLSTCAISGTYAKYVTSGSASDTARVANFGVVINAGGTLYSTKYYEANTTGTGNQPAAASVIAGTGAGYATVAVSSGSDKLVAPGTESAANGLSFGVSGTPEVAVKVAADITAEDIYLGAGTWVVMADVTDYVTAANFGDYSSNLYVYESTAGTYTKVDPASDTYESTATYCQIMDSVANTSAYYPVVYTLDGDTKYTDGSVSVASAQGAAAALVAAIVTGANANATVPTGTLTGNYKVEYTSTEATGNYAANINLATDGPKLGSLNLTWKWDFDNNGAGIYDDQDTILGDLIALENGATNYAIAYSADTSSGYTEVSINNHAVTAGSTSADVIAYLQTGFDIKLTVTQID